MPKLENDAADAGIFSARFPLLCEARLNVDFYVV